MRDSAEWEPGIPAASGLTVSESGATAPLRGRALRGSERLIPLSTRDVGLRRGTGVAELLDAKAAFRAKNDPFPKRTAPVLLNPGVRGPDDLATNAAALERPDASGATAKRGGEAVPFQAVAFAAAAR